jgi:hypothetical protein
MKKLLLKLDLFKWYYENISYRFKWVYW